MKRDYIDKSFKHVKIFYLYNFHGIGHKVNDYRKPKFDNDNRNSRMLRSTNPIGNNERRRSSKRNFRETRPNNGDRSNEGRNQIMCYKCNNFGHIVRNFRAPLNQIESNMRNRALVCQLCNKFGYIARFCRMDTRNLNRNQNYRRNNNKNHRRDNNRQRDEIKEHVEEFKEVFVKAKEPKISFVIVEEEKLFDAHDDRLKSVIVCDSSYLN